MKRFGLTLLVSLIPWSMATGQLRVASPDGRNVVMVDTHEGKLYYMVQRDGRPLLMPSMLGFEFRGAPPLRDGLRIVDSSRNTFDTTWTQPWGEVSRIRDHHNELKVSVAETGPPDRKFTVAVRAFNDGVAFRYEFPAQANLGDFQSTDELTEFAMADNARAWWIASNRPRLDRSEQLWSEGPVSTLDSVQTPLTMEARGGKTFVVIHEANLVEYAKMNIRGPRMDNRTLHADLAPMADGVKVRGHTPFVTPWRTIQVADKVTQLSPSVIGLNLNPPSVVSRYKSLGITATKSGYVTDTITGGHSHWSQRMVQHYRHVIEKAAQYHIMLDVHEPIHDTGERRTYPNMMSREGARGQEYNAWSAEGGNPAEHETILFFTRMLDGPMDFTPGIFDILIERGTGRPRRPDEPRPRTTLAKQLALYVVLYSPLQMAADLPENYEHQPAFQFIRDVAVDWDTTRVLAGKIGDYVVVARRERNAPSWFIGAITDEEGRTFDIPLSFLTPGRRYVAEIYADGPGAHWLTNPLPVSISQRAVDARTSLHLVLAPGGGQAIRIRPAR